ncbi:MAG TPA: M23 family metallopeptidase [Anaerolineae bacterium]|nr:M23 family metallopeptidase [Anaerolineae bacterium]
MSKLKQLITTIRQHPYYPPIRNIFLLTLGLFILWQLINLYRAATDPRNQQFYSWWRGDDATRAQLITTTQDTCPQAPFLLPSEGFIGLLYADPRGPYSARRPHQGIDIFSNADPGLTPVYAAADGYITRESNWRSSLIQRIPHDPLQPDRQIWLYYTHMARHGTTDSDFIEPAFPPGTRDFFVERGTLLGYTGNFNGSAPNPVGTHLHFSIIKDTGNGSYTNELDFNNSIDPSPYLGLNVHYDCQPTNSQTCTLTPTC